MHRKLALYLRRTLFLVWVAFGLYAICFLTAAIAIGLTMAGNGGSLTVEIVMIGVPLLLAFCWWKFSRWLALKVG